MTKVVLCVDRYIVQSCPSSYIPTLINTVHTPRYYLSDKPVALDVDQELIARQTQGETPPLPSDGSDGSRSRSEMSRCGIRGGAHSQVTQDVLSFHSPHSRALHSLTHSLTRLVPHSGFSGADISNLINEAALLAAKQDKDAISPAMIDYAFDKIRMGVERKSVRRTQEVRGQASGGRAELEK